LHPVVAAVLYSFEQAIEDIGKFTEQLTPEQMWMRPHELAPVGFHVRHIAGTVDRLLTYARSEALTAAQMDFLRSEMEPGDSREQLLAEMHQALETAEAELRGMDPEKLEEARSIGRKALPTTLGGLLVHIAEHTQRHVGQAIVTAKLVRAATGNSPALGSVRSR
jgi:uncharacterized damage-inducible protein DinB